MNFSKLQAYMDTLHQQHVPGCDVIVYYQGQPVYRYMTGYADDGRTRPVDTKTLYNLYSCSKPITATAAMQLVEQERLGLDDPVAKYLPAYASAYVVENGKKITVGDTMTIRHLFTMSAGLTYALNPPAIKALREKDPHATTRQVVEAFIEEPLSFRPGEQFQYSLCHDVLAAVIEVVSGQTFGEYLQQHIFAPLGMTDIGFSPTEEQMNRLADQYRVDANTNEVRLEGKSIGGFRITAGYESGGAGLFSTAEAYGRFAAAMSLGGVSADGVRILKPETVAMMQTPQLKQYVRNDAFGCAAGPGYGYGLGVRTLVNKEQGQRSSIGEFGWDGAAGSYALMDPAAQVAIVYTQHVHNWHIGWGCMHAPIRDAVYEALEL